MTPAAPRPARALEVLIWAGVLAGLVEGVRIISGNGIPFLKGGGILWVSVLLSSLIVVAVGVLTERVLWALGALIPLAWLRDRAFRLGFSVVVAALLLPLLAWQNLRRAGITWSLYHLGPYALILVSVGLLAVAVGAVAARLHPEGTRRRLQLTRLVLGTCLAAAGVSWAAVGLLATSSDASPRGDQGLPAEGSLNALLITVDTLRADHLNSYGYPKKTDPELQRHFRDGLRFTQAVTPIPLTRPAHSGMLTGMHPAALGMRRNDQRLGDEFVLLPELLSERGYATAGFISAWPLMGARSGLDRGFGYYSDVFFPLLGVDQALADHTLMIVLRKFRLIDTLHRKAPSVTNLAIEWLRGHHDRPFFLWIHYFDPHHLYEPPPEYSLRMGRLPGQPVNSRPYFSRVRAGQRDFDPSVQAAVAALYDGEILFTDSQIGRLLDEVDRLGLRDRTVVLFTADHGETLLERVSTSGIAFHHGEWISQRDVGIPFMIRGPGIASGERELIAQNYDVAPTLLAALGLPIPDSMMGRDLLAPDAEQHSFENPVLAVNAGFGNWPDLVSARANEYKYVLNVESGIGALYDLSQDPDESRDLSEALPDVAVRLRETAELLPLGGRDQPADLSPEETDRLRALGYVD